MISQHFKQKLNFSYITASETIYWFNSPTALALTPQKNGEKDHQNRISTKSMPDTFCTESGTGLVYETFLPPSMFLIDAETECGRDAYIPKS